jgi:hypothetical protein
VREPALTLRADIRAKAPNCPALIFLLKKIRPTTADSCALNRVTEVVITILWHLAGAQQTASMDDLFAMDGTFWS